jgi:hypothetical protein
MLLIHRSHILAHYVKATIGGKIAFFAAAFLHPLIDGSVHKVGYGEHRAHRTEQNVINKV